MIDFNEWTPEQRREVINTAQRLDVLHSAKDQLRNLKGSFTFNEVNGRSYLIKSFYDGQGRRRQSSVGLRSAETEQIKTDFEHKRAMAQDRHLALAQAMKTQAAINRALGLRRVPRIGSQIVRRLDDAGLLGRGLRLLGTYSLYAFEARAGGFINNPVMSTDDIDILIDSRRQLSFALDDDVDAGGFLSILQRVDRSFTRLPQTFRAANQDGFLVDIIKPLRNPPWQRDAVAPADSDLLPAEIEGLVWLENAPTFSEVAFDDRGEPVRLVTIDPRAWAVHKHWLSHRIDRPVVKRRRDAEQARIAAELTARFMPNLPFDPENLRMLPNDIVQRAAFLFKTEENGGRDRD
jgi:hypothetical protein